MTLPVKPVQSFNVVANDDALILVLGSMPGVRSIAEQEYYAHPRNTFWDIMQVLFSVPRELAYSQRLQLLQQHKVALWDVAHECIRPGSLDANIEQTSVQPNDIPSLLIQCPQIKTICFNGKAAEQLFKKHFKQLYADPKYHYISLPSTSPAHASLTFADKLELWSAIQPIVDK